MRGYQVFEEYRRIIDDFDPDEQTETVCVSRSPIYLSEDKAKKKKAELEAEKDDWFREKVGKSKYFIKESEIEE